MSVELYRNTERYIVITGNPLPDTKALANIDAQLDATVAELEAKKAQAQRGKANGAGGNQRTRPEVEGGEDELWHTIKHCNVPVGERSNQVWWVVNEMLRRGYLPERIVATLLDACNKISEHVYDQGNPGRYARKQVHDAKREAKLAADESGVVFKTQANIRVALLKLGRNSTV